MADERGITVGAREPRLVLNSVGVMPESGEWGGRPGWKTFGGGCARSDVCAVGHHAWRRGRVGAGTRRGSFSVQISFLLLLLLLLVADHGEVGLVLFVHVSRAVRAPLGAKATPAR